MTFCISITKHVNKGGIDVHGVPPDTELLFKPGRMRAKIKLHFLIEPPPSEKHTHTRVQRSARTRIPIWIPTITGTAVFL